MRGSTMEFYSSDAQPIIGPVVMLPQKGSTSGGSKRPLNSYAVLREGHSILFDAPFSWVMDGIHRLASDGHPPAAMAISHRDLAGSGDAFEAFSQAFGVPILMHPADQAEDAPSELDVPLGDPMDGEGGRLLHEAGIEVIHVPGHSPGSIMLYLPDEGGILLAGDCAVGPGPDQTDRTPRLERTIAIEDEARFADIWQKIVDRLPLAGVLPLHGEMYLRRDRPDDFDRIVVNIWSGKPMDPRKV